MEFDQALNESFQRYKLSYKGTRKNYEINDPFPYVLSIDDSYNPDDNGLSILGINLNYVNGDKEKLVKKINDFDNKNGFRGFETRLKVKKFLNKKEDFEEYETNMRKKRYDSFIKQFPELAKYVRRYKASGPNGSGIKSKKRKFLR